MNAKAWAVVIAIFGAAGVAAWLLFAGGGLGGPGAAREEAEAAAARAQALASASAAASRSSGAAKRPGDAALERALPPPPASGESTVVGRIVDAATRSTIGDADVVLRHPQGEFAVVAKSRADGAFTLDRVPGVVGARVFVGAPGYGPRAIRDVHVPPHDRLDLGAIELERGVPVQGLVATTAGAPIAGAQVDLLATIANTEDAFNLVTIFRELRRDDDSLDQALTAADGTFTFPAAAPGRYVVVASKPGWQIRYSEPFSVVPSAAPPNVTVRLVEGRKLRGIVKDQGGAPVAGADVAALEIEPQAVLLTKSQKTRTGADGRFAYSTFGAGEIAVVVGAPGYSGVSKAALKAGGPETEIVLRKAARIEGRVYDRATGKGLPGATVVAFQMSKSVALEETRTGADGAYVIEAGPSGENVSVFAKIPGYSSAADSEPREPRDGESPMEDLFGSENVEPGAVVHRDFPMVGGGSLSGRVVDAKTGEGIAGAEVTLRRVGPFEFFGHSDPVMVKTGADGAFTSPPLGAGKATAAAHAAGYLPSNDRDPDSPVDVGTPPDSPTAEIPAGGSASGVVIKLRRGVDLDVLVTDPDGTPIAGASVSWARPDENAFLFMKEKRPRGVPTDAAGKVRLRGVAPAAAVLVAARHPSFPMGNHVKVDATTPPERPITIALVRSASLAGVVMDADGRPALDRRVQFKSEQTAVSQAFGDWLWEGYQAVTDSAGKFVFDNLPPGPGSIEIADRRARDEDTGELGPGDREDCVDPAQAALTLVSGKREEVRLQLLRTFEIRGRVLDAAGQPVRGQFVRASLKDGANIEYTESKEDGTFRFGGLAPGDHVIEVDDMPEGPDKPPSVVRRTVTAGTTGVELRLRSGAVESTSGTNPPR